MTAWLSAAVIGGGIAGTTAALALAKIGADVEVYEATTRTTAEGGWVTLGPSAITALDQLGVGEQIRAVGFPVVEARMMNTVTGREDRLSRMRPATAGQARMSGAETCFQYCAIVSIKWMSTVTSTPLSPQTRQAPISLSGPTEHARQPGAYSETRHR